MPFRMVMRFQPSSRFGSSLAAGAELFAAVRAIKSRRSLPFERNDRFDEERFERIRQFHSDTSSVGFS